MSVFEALVPGATVVFLSFVAALPWGIPSESRFILPLLPYMAIHYWASSHRPDRMPLWLAFICGLGVDILTNGPLGYFSLIYVLGHAVSTSAGGVRSGGARSDGAMTRWLVFVAAMSVVVTAAWIVTSLYYLELADWKPYGLAGVVAAALYPVLAGMLGAMSPGRPRRANTHFERGV